jgi:hypothetical protein
MACSNLSGVVMRNNPRASMRIAPGGPGNSCSFRSSLNFQDVRRAVLPFTSSIISSRKTRWDDFLKPSGDTGHATEAVTCSSNTVLWLTITHAIRASLLANAHATTQECRRASIARVQSAMGPECLSSRSMNAGHTGPAGGGYSCRLAWKSRAGSIYRLYCIALGPAPLRRRSLGCIGTAFRRRAPRRED